MASWRLTGQFAHRGSQSPQGKITEHRGGHGRQITETERIMSDNYEKRQHLHKTLVAVLGMIQRSAPLPGLAISFGATPKLHGKGSRRLLPRGRTP